MKKIKKNKKGIISALIVLAVLIVSAVLSLNNGSAWKKIIAYTAADSAEISKVQQSKAANEALSVHYIDVDQGDSTLIHFNKYYILIDCAKAAYEDNVLNYLQQNNISKLDLAVETHPDADHIGGFSYVLSNIKCDKFILPMLPSSIKKTQTEATLISTLKTQKINTEYAVSKKTYTYGDMVLTTYITEKTHEDKNDYSVVILLKYKDASYLFMGDASKTVENEFMDNGYELKADILKAGHHGSSKSTSEKFINYVKPTVVIFSCGKNNEYGHPHSEVLALMQKYNLQYFRTDRQGTVVIGTDGSTYYTACEKDD